MAFNPAPYLAMLLACALPLAGCGPSYSPDSYDSGAVQKANPVDQGVIIGARPVGVTNDGSTGAVTGAAAGGIAGSQLPGSGATSALGALGGSLIGSLVGRSTEKVAGATTAYEYIVRKADDKLISVTQQDELPLVVGMHVLVIAGAQARIVPDYTVKVAPPNKADKVTPVVPPTTPLPAPSAAPTSSPSATPPPIAPAEASPAATPATVVTPAVPPPAAPPASLDQT